MKSMTGFGRAEVNAPFGRIVTEIQAVNRKYLEVNVSLPKEFTRFENSIRKLVNDSVARGSVSVRIYVFPNSDAIDHSMPKLDILQSLKKNWEELAISLGYDRPVIDFPFLLKCLENLPQIKVVNEEDFHPFTLCIHQAIEALQTMKGVEGKALAKDILARLTEIGNCVTIIEKTAPDAVEKLRLKLKERMNEVLTPGVELDDRLLREVALYAERLDISEEITRFRSHIIQYESLLNSKEVSGRKMDFLIQEMGREINTMGSKATDAKVAHLVVEVKSELEKIREQIQNIE
jgi:uncharacterized protein (TIGR00255 family)